MDNMEEGLVLVDHVADVNTSAAPRSVSNAQESQIMAFYLSMADGQVMIRVLVHIIIFFTAS